MVWTLSVVLYNWSQCTESGTTTPTAFFTRRNKKWKKKFTLFHIECSVCSKNIKTLRKFIQNQVFFSKFIWWNFHLNIIWKRIAKQKRIPETKITSPEFPEFPGSSPTVIPQISKEQESPAALIPRFAVVIAWFKIASPGQALATSLKFLL